jgi:hypothetical protein
MNKGQKVVAGLLGVVAVELAVLDYAAWTAMRNGVVVEVSSEELANAGEQALIDMEGE